MESLAPPSDYRIGVDTGGTFTDLVLVDDSGKLIQTHKLLSTSEDPGRAVREGVQRLLEKAGIEFQHLQTVVHGSTVATNAVLENKGDPTALITTSGFEDVLYLGRQNRPELYDLVPSKVPPPIPRERTIGVAERIDYAGKVLQDLTEDEISRVLNQLDAMGVAAAAICLLHSYANPEHEQALARAIKENLPGIHLTVSSELLPEIREYERSATCAVNAMVGPMMSRYVGKLNETLGERKLRIMGTGGGTLNPAMVTRRPVETIMSGPAGGVMGGWAMAQSAGEHRVGQGAISFDMGGTSTDVSLIDGSPRRTTETVIAGLPIKLPMIDIHTVGSGGGSIAWIDQGGALRVGPQSAGADPGPACYGLQTGKTSGWLATVTDAHVVLGHIRDKRLLGESLAIDLAKAEHAVGQLAEQLKMPIHDAAEGILRVADVAMARAVQRVSVQRGYDARQFTLIAFGGAGGLHACRLAEVLGMSRVLIPQHGGLLSAVGMLAAPPRYAFSQAVAATLTPDHETYADPLSLEPVARAAEQVFALGRDALSQDGVAAEDQTLVLQLDLRFAGQSYEICVPAQGPNHAASSFLSEHRRLYGYAPVGKPVEIVAVRVEATGKSPELKLTPQETGKDQSARQANVSRPVWSAGEKNHWPFISRDSLSPGDQHAGPLVIEEYAATTVVPDAWNMEVLDDGQLALNR